MAVNVTVRDIENFPGGTAKTITVDIVQIVPVAGNPEGDEIWVTSTTTAATASGGGSIQNIFKNEMKRGWLKSSGQASGLITILASSGFKIAIDEAIGNGVDITLTAGSSLLLQDIAQDIEDTIKAEAETGGGGAKIGNLSYLNAQVRFVSGKFQIESGTSSSLFTTTAGSTVAIAAPDSGTDVRSLLGLDITLTSQILAGRQISETFLASAYTTGNILTVDDTSGFSAGDGMVISDGTSSQNAVISGAGVTDGLAAAELRFATASGSDNGLSNPYAINSVVRALHQVDVADPVSAITTVDELYRSTIDSQVNQIDFSS